MPYQNNVKFLSFILGHHPVVWNQRQKICWKVHSKLFEIRCFISSYKVICRTHFLVLQYLPSKFGFHCVVIRIWKGKGLARTHTQLLRSLAVIIATCA